tara:strand:- start:29 stop:697 length:669 start_codon:yes stop_codon:yes gene_type:complete
MIQTSFFPQPEKDKPIKIIQIDPSGLQPRKVEEFLPDDDILLDTFMVYPTGGYHPFYGVPNTFPRYQLPIWPFIKRIKFSEKYKSQERLDRVRRGSLQDGEGKTNNQINPSWDKDYFYINLQRNSFMETTKHTEIKKNGETVKTTVRNLKKMPIHRIIALAFIPNPKNYPIVMHDNDDKTNYLIENLKWGTWSMNATGQMRRRPDTWEHKYLALVKREIIKG